MGLHGGPGQLLGEPAPKAEADLEGLHGLDPHLRLEELHHFISGREFKDTILMDQALEDKTLKDKTLSSSRTTRV